MARDLTNSVNDRRSILGNETATKEIYGQLGFAGIFFEGKYWFSKSQIATFYEVDNRTIERLIESYADEISENGYEIFRGSRLRNFRKSFADIGDIGDVSDTGVGDISQHTENEILNTKAPSIGLFTFKAFLNIGMLLTTSERAKEVRSAILNIVIDLLNKKFGGSTKFINQREEEFLPSAIREYNYRREFANALDLYIVSNKFKYAELTDKIYISIFKENAREYRQILCLNADDDERITMYSEVLDLVASYENGFADFLKKDYEKKGNKKLSISQAHLLFVEFERITDRVYQPLKDKARALMASRDMAFREALHEKLKEYIDSVSLDDIDRFLGDKSKVLEQRIEENKEVFKRLKDR